MGYPTSNRFHQIHVPRNGHGYEHVESYDAETATCHQDHESLQSSLLQICPAEVWPKNSYTAGCPWPVLVTTQHQQRLIELHEALVLAITDIVERWWIDPVACFPERMPLEKKEEELLRWMDTQVPEVLPYYRECLGSWRPDFLIEQDSCGKAVEENFRISEINARFSFNGLMHIAYGQQALCDIGISDRSTSLKNATNPTKILGGLLHLFQPNRPLHLLKGEEPGLDIHMFVDFVQHHLGRTPRFITPADLRLFPDPKSQGKFKLCCVKKSAKHPDADSSNPMINAEGELLEEIHQVGLELHQRELLALPPSMLHHISLRCFNDLRTILLVHDKRMLGIVKQELKSLVARDILTPSQAHSLDTGIAETVLPGSMELGKLIQHCREFPELKNEYILKPIRSGKGDGIVFGDDLTPAEWESRLECLRCSKLIPGGSTCVVQRKVNQLLYDVMLGASGTKTRYHLIGTYHSIGGQYLGLGIWRSSSDRVCAVSRGGAWMCSVMSRD